MGLVCFRLKGSNALNQKLLSIINASGKLHMVPASLNDKYVIRFCVCRENATDSDMGKSTLTGTNIRKGISMTIFLFFMKEYAWKVIKEYAEDVLRLHKDQDAQVIKGSESSSRPSSTSSDTRRPSKEVEELFKELEANSRRHTLARATSIIDETFSRTSVDLTEEDSLLPRSRRGSLFPVSTFVDDFNVVVPNPRDRSGSILVPFMKHMSIIEREEDEVAANVVENDRGKESSDK